MKTTGSPFAIIDSHAYLIKNFTLDLSSGCPSLKEMLEELLENYSGSDILILRRLTDAETKIFVDSVRDREHETWAQITASQPEKDI